MAASNSQQPLVMWLQDVGVADLPQVGGKNSSLGEMIQSLTKKGVQVPGGFATTAYAYRLFLDRTGLRAKLKALFANLDVANVAQLQSKGLRAREMVLAAPLPSELTDAIVASYKQMCAQYGGHSNDNGNGAADGSASKEGHASLDCAVRSSATAEDLPEASFAGQQETYLNVHGSQRIVDACHKCYASLFTNRAISYRVEHGFDHMDVALSVGVQRMVRADQASAGVAFTLDTETGFTGAVLVTGAYGLGENVVQGAVNPDEWLVGKAPLRAAPANDGGFRPIVGQRLGSKELQMVYDMGAGKLTKQLPVPQWKRKQFCLCEDEVLQLARWALAIEEHYSAVHGKPTPMDIEWAKDGKTGELWIVQARPETVQSRKNHAVIEEYSFEDNATAQGDEEPAHAVLATGRACGGKVGVGAARIIDTPQGILDFKEGEVLVTDRTDPDWEPIMKKAGAVVTNQGGRTCHAAIIAREMGVPAIVGCGDATKTIADGGMVTVSCCEGEEGRVYAGARKFNLKRTELASLPDTRTKILINLAEPELAFQMSSLPVDGVGLVRLEFVIANVIRVHPMALVQYDELAKRDPEAKKEVDSLTAGYPADRKGDYFVDHLARAIGRIACAFHPRPCIVRLSDFKTNEYHSLVGGSTYEPAEANPMLGWRGASRYYDPRYRDAFQLEVRALKKVRETMGYTNIIPMVPFCRTPEEGRKVLAEMARGGLKQGVNGLQVYCMTELVSNVVLADEFAKVFDGFSIGSNDLTQVTLGVDRDSEQVAHLFDERNPAVKAMIAQAIQKSRANGRKIGICGQAPSEYPEFARFLVEQGIDSISLNPDTAVAARLRVAEAEKQV